MLLTENRKQDLVGWWKMEIASGNRPDETANGNNLSETPNAVAHTPTLQREGLAAAGLFATDGLQRTDANLSSIFPGKSAGSASRTFTIGCFLHPAAGGSGSDIAIAKLGSYSLYYNYTSSKITAQINNATAIGADATSPTAKYACAAIRWNGSEFSLWVNGAKQAATSTGITALTLNSNPFVIGAEDNAGTNFFNGYIDDAYVFARALSDYEMKIISMVGASAFFNPGNGLVAAWMMEQAAGSQRLDWGPYALHLSENGNVPQSTTIVKRGSAAAGKFSTTPSCLKIIDADLPSHFPWKNGGTAREWTIGMWIYQDATANTCAFKKGTAIELQWGFPGANQYGLLFNNSLLLVSPSIATGAYRHIAMRWRGDDDDLFELFVDGVRQGGGSVQTANAGNASDLIIGAQTTLNGLPTNGYIDEVFIFNRALADQEVLDIYQQGLEAALVPSFSDGTIFHPLPGRKPPKPNLKFLRKGQTRGGNGGGGKNGGSGARW